MLGLSAICLMLFSGLVASQDSNPPDENNAWISDPGPPGPPININKTVYQQNVVWQNNQPHSLRWRATFPVQVLCFQQLTTEQRSIEVYKGTKDNVLWNGTVNDAWLDDGNVFLFIVYNTSRPGTGGIFYSHYFNITRATSSSASPSPSSTGPAIVSSTPVSNNGGSGGGSGGSSNGAAIGAGVGGGVGAIIIAALVFWFVRRRRNKRNQEKNNSDNNNNVDNAEAPVIHEAPSEMPSPSQHPPNEKQSHFPFHGKYAPTGYNFSPPQSPEPAPAYKPTYELSEHEPRHELDSTSARR